MMICAVYARKSTEQTGNADELSVARQLAAARAFADARWWSIADAHVYSDRGVSGAEFARRPGLVRLLAALKPRPPFGVLLVTDRDRLGREQVETSYLLKQLITAGVRVFEVGKGQEIMLTTPTDKVLASVVAFAGELEREQARARTHAALAHRARAGRALGGTCFGYTTTTTAEGHTVRAIVEPEAAVVRRMFALAAGGHGVKAIARALNAEGALAPQRRGVSRGWAPSSVRGVLHNTIYAGTVTWNRTRKRDAWGQRNPSRRDPGDVIRAEVPELRLVDAALWQRAHERLAAGRALYEAKNRGTLLAGRPSGGASRYLLTGLAICAPCGGGMMARKRDQRAVYFGCSTRHLRGLAVCGNRLEVRLADADTAVLQAVESQLLDVAVLETALFKALAVLEGQREQDGAEPLRQELARLDAEVGRLTAAIAAGGALESLLAALQDREQHRAHFRVAITEHERQQAARSDPGDALAVMREASRDWRGMLHAETGPARTALQALLAARLTFTPGPDGYEFSAPGTVAPIIAGLVPKGIGARTRTISPALRRALHHRDRHCRFPGCGSRFTQGHHLRHWAQGGPTTLSNPALLCRRHHRAVHEEGYRVARGPDGALRFRRPDGRPLPEVPPPVAVPADPVNALRAHHAAQGLRLDARTAIPGWVGERLDLGWAIDVMHPLARRASTVSSCPSPSGG
jgi:site-specific DNA recombinase